MPKKRLSIAYLAPVIRDDNGYALWMGAEKAAKENDVNLINFIGGWIDDPKGFRSQANIIYNLVSKENIDGIISWASSLGSYIGAESTKNFHKSLYPLPIVAVGGLVEGFPSILVDSYNSMRTGIIHLIKKHGYRKIVFIRGPENNIHAKERYRAYLDVLNEFNTQPDPELVSPPLSWSHSEALESMRSMLDEKKLQPKIDFEAIVGCSDELLLGALELIKSRGFHIPEDIAALGFDSGALGKSHNPPVTSLESPHFELGYQGVEMLLSLINGEKATEKKIAPKLKIAQSCGCQSISIELASKLKYNIKNKFLFNSDLSRHQGEIVKLMIEEFGNSEECHDSMKQIFNGFVINLKNRSKNIFLQILNNEFLKLKNKDAEKWQNILSLMRLKIISLLNNNSKKIIYAENLFHQARILIDENLRRIQILQSIHMTKKAQKLYEIGEKLSSNFDIGELTDILASELHNLKINNCYLSLYENPSNYQYPEKAPEWSNLILAYDKNRRIKLESDNMRFTTNLLLPKEMWNFNERVSLVVESLFFRDNQIGYVLFDCEEYDANLLDSLQSQIRNAIKGSLLVKQIQNQSNTLKEGIIILAESIEEMSVNINKISSNMDEQAAAVSESASSIEEIARNIDNMTIMSNKVDKLSNDLNNVSNTGNSLLKDSAKVIKEVSVNSQKIIDLLNLIKDISEKTNILAINASIQAAHAGESGKAFKIVASEIRKLADETNNNINHIEIAVKSIISKITNSVMLTEKTTDSIETISVYSNQNKEISDNLNFSMIEQNRGTKEIVKSTQELVEITEEVKQAITKQRKTTEDFEVALKKLKHIST